MSLKKLDHYPKFWLWGTIFWMAVIFVLSTNLFSAQRTTDKIDTEIPLRNIAHLVVYFILGFLSSGAVRLNFSWKQKWLITLFFCIFYAFTDEVHHFFELERRFRFIDIAIDSVGAFAGILFYNLLYLKLFKSRILRK